MREVVFGDIGINPEVISPDPCGGTVPSAGALVLTFLLNNYEDRDYQRLAEQWEKEVRKTAESAVEKLRPRPSRFVLCCRLNGCDVCPASFFFTWPHCLK